MRPKRLSGLVAADDLPEVLCNRTELVGLFVGGCVERGAGSSFRAMAHAHISGPYMGFICVRGWRRVYNKSLMLHELAHIIAKEGHTDKWRATLRELGGRVEARYKKRVRKQCACGAHQFNGEQAWWIAGENNWHSWRRCG